MGRRWQRGCCSSPCRCASPCSRSHWLEQKAKGKNPVGDSTSHPSGAAAEPPTTKAALNKEIGAARTLGNKIAAHQKRIAASSEKARSSRAELEALPMLCRGASLRFLLTRLYDWLNCPAGALVQPKDPMEYAAYLSFHRQVEGPGAYGLD